MYRTIVTLPVVCLSALQPVFPLIYGRSKRTKQGRDGTVTLVKIYKGVRLVCDFRVRRGFSHGVVMTCASSRGNYVGRPIGTTAKLVVRQNTTWPPWKTSRLRNTRALGVGKVHQAVSDILEFYALGISPDIPKDAGGSCHWW